AARLTHNPMALARALYKAMASGVVSAPVPGSTFLGGAGQRAHREALERIRRLVAMAESGRFREGEGG
ncbi:MAG: hypothetical protein L3K05_02860, partial [Thermoplasmata archaeon]|nr:hypothetical protein [Thermoplasmata archaeon]